MPKEPELILLDTHIWVWQMTGVSKATSLPLRALIQRLIPKKAIRVSAISVWEVALLSEKGKIEFPEGLEEWVHRAMNAPGVIPVDVTPEIALKSTLLPENFHRDPGDRILIATAIQTGATLITHDKEILTYAKKYNLPAITL